MRPLPAIAVRADGTFVVAWTSEYSGEDSDIVAQQFDAAMTPAGVALQVNTGPDAHWLPAIATDQAGHFVVVWTDRGNLENYRAITHVRAFDASGPLTSDSTIAVQPGVSPSARVAMRDESGESLVTWFQLGGDNDDFGIVGRRLDTAGAALGTEFQINTYTSSYQGRPDITAQDNGFVVVWHSYGEDGQGFGVFGQRLAADGTPVGSEFQVNEYTTYDQAQPSVSADSEGRFVVVWESYDTTFGGPAGQDGDGHGIFGRAFDREARPFGSEFQVNTYTTGNQGNLRLPEADVAMYTDGDFVVVWNSPEQDGWGTGIFAQRFHLDPTLGPLCGDSSGADLRLSLSDGLAALRAAVALQSCEL